MDDRKLVGMTMGAKKRAAIYDCVGHKFIKSVKLTWFKCWNRDYHSRVATIDDTKTNQRYQTLRGLYRIGQRLRPCPGCSKCGSQVRRFSPTAGWKSPRKWILWDGARLWMIARTWRRLCTMPTLDDYTSGVDDGTWRELFCDGSGVLPAKKAKAKR